MIFGTVLAASALAICGAASAAGLMVVNETQVAGTQGGTSVAGTQTRTLNTTVFNSIAGASLAGNQISLPGASTYVLTFSAPAFGAARNQACINDVTTSTNYCGTNAYTTGGVGIGINAIGTVVITTAGAEVIELEHYFQTGTATVGLGVNNASGFPSIFSTVTIQQM